MRLLIAGGGTGGHLYPGIAIAEEVTARPGGQVLFVGTARGLEAKLVPAAGFPLELLEITGLNRVGLGKFMKGIALLPKAFFTSRSLLLRFRPDLVLGVGGYASGPLVLTAALLGYPTAIQEQNSQPGITNRILGKFVRRVFVAFDDARASFSVRKTILCGNPVRRRFMSAGASRATSLSSNVHAPVEPAARPPMAPGRGPPTVLILGGSQGARAVNDLVIGAAAALAAEGRLPRIIHQTGASDEARVRQLYVDLRLGDRVEILSFIDDMPAALGAATLVVARAGALTLAELAMVGRPAILIPLPTAADDHQTRNAAEFVRAGAAMLAEQRHTTSESLARLIVDLGADPGRLGQMSRAMAALGRPAAAAEIVDELERVSGVVAHTGDKTVPDRGSKN